MAGERGPCRNCGPGNDARRSGAPSMTVCPLRTRLHHGYRYKNRLVIAAVMVVDFVVGLIPRQKTPLPEKVTRILLMKPDHLGDLLLATAVFPLIAARYPDASIDLLCGSWGKSVVADNRNLRTILSFDHLLYNRNPQTLFRKLLDFWQSLMHTIKILRQERYDLCLNLRDAGGDLVLLARVGNCRHVVGHATGGFGALLDTVAPWVEGKHEAEHYLELLAPLGIRAELADLQYSLVPSSEDELTVDRLLEHAGLSRFAVIHPGSGDRRKLRSADFWKAVIQDVPGNCSIVVTGTGAELSLFQPIAEGAGRELICLMGQLSVAQLLALFRRAETIYCLDSLAAHLGGAAGVKTVVFWSETNDPVQWRPLGNHVELIGS